MKFKFKQHRNGDLRTKKCFAWIPTQLAVPLHTGCTEWVWLEIIYKDQIFREQWESWNYWGTLKVYQINENKTEA
jgi:hypothetical protein